MHPLALLFVYSLLCMAASWAGGWVPLLVHLTHRRMQIAVSFVSGIVLGIGLLHLVPHAYESLGSIDRTMWWVMGGFLVMFFLERFFHFHHHEAPEEHLVLVEEHAESSDSDAEAPTSAHAPAHAHAHSHAHAHAHAHHDAENGGGSFSLVGVAVGLSLHGLIDGVAVAAAVMAESAHAGVVLAGVGTLLAVALHKPLDGLTIGTLMATKGHPQATRRLFNAAYALVTPLGMLLFYLLSTSTSVLEHSLGEVLGFAAGAFVCIATGDLLPELQFHRHDRMALSVSLLVGIAVAWGTVFLETGGHDHFHPPAPAGAASDHDHDHEHAGEHDHGEHDRDAGHDHEHEPHDHDQEGADEHDAEESP